jgi:hypothetical protein
MPPPRSRASAAHLRTDLGGASGALDRPTCALVDGVPTAALVVSYEGFHASDGLVRGTITLDSVDESVGPFTWVGSSSYTWSKATTAGVHTVAAVFRWANQGTRDGKVDAVTFTCPAPPDTTPPATPPPPATTTPPPAGAVLPETIASGTARLRGASGCAKQAFSARVSGRSIAAVAFYVDGRLMKNITSMRSAYRMTVRPGRYSTGRHKVVARVRFTAASGTQARRLRLTFRRCAQAAVAPRFTG